MPLRLACDLMAKHCIALAAEGRAANQPVQWTSVHSRSTLVR
jgi:hypothetical protein